MNPNYSQVYAQDVSLFMESGDFMESAGVPKSHGPWVRRRHVTSRDQATVSGLVLPEGLVRFPRGPDGTCGFHPGSRPESLEGQNPMMWMSEESRQEPYPYYEENALYMDASGYFYPNQSYASVSHGYNRGPQYDHHMYTTAMGQDAHRYSDQASGYVYLDQGNYSSQLQPSYSYVDTAYNQAYANTKYTTGHHYSNDSKYNSHYYNNYYNAHSRNGSQEYTYQPAQMYNYNYQISDAIKSVKSDDDLNIPAKYEQPISNHSDNGDIQANGKLDDVLSAVQHDASQDPTV